MENSYRPVNTQKAFYMITFNICSTIKYTDISRFFAYLFHLIILFSEPSSFRTDHTFGNFFNKWQTVRVQKKDIVLSKYHKCQHKLQLASKDTVAVLLALPMALNRNYFQCMKWATPDYVQFIFFCANKHSLSTKCYWDQLVTILSSCCHT